MATTIMVILDATPAPTAASPKINADTMLIEMVKEGYQANAKESISDIS